MSTEQMSPATVGDGSEARAAAVGGQSAAGQAKAITGRAKGARSPVGGQAHHPRQQRVETPLEALLRLNGEAARDVGRLTMEVAAAGEPARALLANSSAVRAARREAGAMVERLIAFLDAIEGDPDSEPSLAVPEVEHWESQERVWRAACRSRLRDQELEPNLGFECRERHSQDVLLGARSADPGLDELEHDLDTEEADELDEKECAYEDLGEADDAEQEGDDFPYSQTTRRRAWAPTEACTAQVKAALRDPARRKDIIKPRAQFENVGPIIASWRVE